MTQNKMKKKTYQGEVGELFAVSYMPEWAKKYPMWINNILFCLLNHSRFLRRFERYL